MALPIDVMKTHNPKHESPNFFPGKSIIARSKLKGQNFQYFSTPLGTVPNIHYFASEKKDNVLSHSEGADLKFSDVKIHH